MTSMPHTDAFHSAGQQDYNGWPSYETWLVALWLGNDPETEALVQGLVAAAESPYDAAQALKALVEELSPLGETSGLHTDLLTAALSHVDWHAVAQHFAPTPTDPRQRGMGRKGEGDQRHGR
jgi:hypothetical protein